MSGAPSDPTSRAHARLSASGSKRWMACPGSVSMAESVPEELRETRNVFADLGTAAHTLGETCLRAGLHSSDWYMGWWINQEGDVTNDWRSLVPDGGEEPPYGWFQVDQDMVEAVDVYLGFVWSEVERLGGTAELNVEHKFDLSWVRPNMFGTNDANVSQFMGELSVIDYKNGQGVPVEVVDPDNGKPNSQLLYYGLGAAHDEGFLHETVRITIVQPRCPHSAGAVRSHVVTMDELKAFAEELGTAADQVHRADEEFHELVDQADFMDWSARWLEPGKHCSSTFCPAAATCPALRAWVQEQAAVDFAEEPREVPVPHDLGALADAWRWAGALDAYVKQVKASVERAMLAGHRLPGFKWVAGKSTRQWVLPEDELVGVLEMKGLEQRDLYEEPKPPKLKSPAKLEKLGKEVKLLVNGKFDKKTGEWTIEPLAAKRPGKLTVALTTDPRPEVPFDASSVEQDFADVTEDEE